MTAVSDTNFGPPRAPTTIRVTTRKPKKTALPRSGYEHAASSTRAPAETPIPDAAVAPAPDAGSPKDCDPKV
ncbi:hypothetical protein MP638_003247 [Amoeboaphelidium occidentale]|nr:hypothetical protein MP638_003247 [Amoeboaphelidium occidentale]